MKMDANFKMQCECICDDQNRPFFGRLSYFLSQTSLPIAPWPVWIPIFHQIQYEFVSSRCFCVLLLPATHLPCWTLLTSLLCIALSYRVWHLDFTSVFWWGPFSSSGHRSICHICTCGDVHVPLNSAHLSRHRIRPLISKGTTDL